IDFFSYIIFDLFQDEGIVLMDSAHPEIRQIEKPYFKKMIQHQEEIAAGVYETKQQLEQAGFPIMMDTEITSGKLFYKYQNERLRIERNLEGDWIGKGEDMLLRTEALLNI